MAQSLSASRKVFAAVMFALALGIPLGIAKAAGMTRDSVNAVQIAFLLLPPLGAFAAVGFAALFFRSARFVSLWGAAIGAMLAIGVPDGWAWYCIACHAGDDLGAGVILLGAPIYVVIAVSLGWHLADAFFPCRD